MPRGVSKKRRFGLCKLKGCGLRFLKKNSKQLFCCREHKDAFHRRGQFPFERTKHEIMLAVEVELKPLRTRLERVERELTEARAESSKALYLLTQHGLARGATTQTERQRQDELDALMHRHERVAGAR